MRTRACRNPRSQGAVAGLARACSLWHASRSEGVEVWPWVGLTPCARCAGGDSDSDGGGRGRGGDDDDSLGSSDGSASDFDDKFNDDDIDSDDGGDSALDSGSENDF